jgi:acid phosphatase type 7
VHHGEIKPLWDALYGARAELVLAGHDHYYERFAKQTPAGVADSVRGIRSFVIGHGGKNLYEFGTIKPNSQFRERSFGIVELTLRPTGYDWAMIREDGAIRDAGSDACH